MDRRLNIEHRNVEADQAVLIGRVRQVMGAVARQAGRDILVRIVLEGNFPIHNQPVNSDLTLEKALHLLGVPTRYRVSLDCYLG
jgi:hypothetical protein